MTQEVQPLTWQKRTNIEEHQQFFAKINEIVGQLSGTVERSETALTNARTAVATANAASAQAIEAATTVAGFNTRLTAVEVQAATNKSDISQLDVETQDLYDRDAQSVKLSADHIQVITGGLDLRGTNRSPNTSVGADDTIIANGHRIVQELTAYGSTVDAKLNAYSQMVRTSGNQTIGGQKTFTSNISMFVPDKVLERPTENVYRGIIQNDADNVRALEMYRGHYTNGQNDFYITLRGENNAIARLHLTINANGSGRLYLDPPDPSAADVQIAQWPAYTPE